MIIISPRPRPQVVLAVSAAAYITYSTRQPGGPRRHGKMFVM